MSVDYQSDLTGQEMVSAVRDLNNHTTLYGAEAWTKGTKGGVDVGSTDPTYHNNARYYAELAQSAVPVGAEGAVLWNQSQNLVESEKKQGRLNIGAINGDIVAMRGWNQLIIGTVQVTNWGGITVSVNNGRITGSGTTTSTFESRIQYLDIVNGHKYLLKTPNTYTINWELYPPRFTISTDTRSEHEILLTANSSGAIGLYARGGSGVTLDVDGYYQFIDLTSIFGAGNEPSPVAEFRSMFPSDYYPYCQGGFGDLLWTNASPTSAFPAQTISLDLSNYSNLMIEFRRSIDRVSCMSAMAGKVFEKGLLMCMDSGRLQSREFPISGNNITFNEGYIYDTYGGYPTLNNSVCVPARIYGIR